VLFVEDHLGSIRVEQGLCVCDFFNERCKFYIIVIQAGGKQVDLFWFYKRLIALNVDHKIKTGFKFLIGFKATVRSALVIWRCHDHFPSELLHMAEDLFMVSSYKYFAKGTCLA